MEYRKYQLQKQIVEALKANDNNLYTLLKSQWAHRFGVESLEELKSIDLNDLNKKTTNLNIDNQKIDQSIKNTLDSDKTISKRDTNNQEKDIKNNTLESSIEKNNKLKSYDINYKDNNINKAINKVKENKNQPEIKALIPIPPKPKYSYLKKWLLRK